MNQSTLPPFFFSQRYRLLRHSLYWCGYLLVWTCFWNLVHLTFFENLQKMIIWLPMFMLFAYPPAYLALPLLLLKKRYLGFIVAIILWGIAGWFGNMVFRVNVFFPVTDWLKIHHGTLVAEPASFLCMTTTAGSMTISTLAKRWYKKQHEYMQAEGERMKAQMELLKAQLHPHFLFNTLNNIYAFALERSAITHKLVLKLSSLLSYVLYDCKAEEVLLEKEIEVMQDYIGLEKERYVDQLDISINIEGDFRNQPIAPLLILPFLENAFKHGTSEQIERPWMSIDVRLKGNQFLCKVVNSKNEDVLYHEQGVGILNVRKRLQLLYPEKHELKLSDEGSFFVVSLAVQLQPPIASPLTGGVSLNIKTKSAYEDKMSAR